MTTTYRSTYSKRVPHPLDRAKPLRLTDSTRHGLEEQKEVLDLERRRWRLGLITDADFAAVVRAPADASL